MAKKTFKEIEGVCLHENGQIGNFFYCKCGKYSDYKITHQGDPIFVVDVPSNAIKVYIVKCQLLHFNGMVSLKCCEKGKQQNFKPTQDSFYSDMPFEGCVTFTVNAEKSKDGLIATTLEDAIKTLNSFKNKGCFASLRGGDKVYSVNRITKAIEELVISAVVPLRIDTFNFETTNGTRFSIKHSYYRDNASKFNDSAFGYYDIDKHWSQNFNVFVNKEKAEAFVRERNKIEEKKNKSLEKGIDTKLKDCEGKPIHVGDTVAYVNGSGPFFRLSVAKVINFTNKMIKIFDEKERKKYIEYNGLTSLEYDITNFGIKLIGTNKILVIKK